jgi:hypothetical protein
MDGLNHFSSEDAGNSVAFKITLDDLGLYRTPDFVQLLELLVFFVLFLIISFIHEFDLYFKGIQVYSAKIKRRVPPPISPFSLEF